MSDLNKKHPKEHIRLLSQQGFIAGKYNLIASIFLQGILRVGYSARANYVANKLSVGKSKEKKWNETENKPTDYQAVGRVESKNPFRKLDANVHAHAIAWPHTYHTPYHIIHIECV